MNSFTPEPSNGGLSTMIKGIPRSTAAAIGRTKSSAPRVITETPPVRPPITWLKICTSRVLSTIFGPATAAGTEVTSRRRW